MPGIDYNAPPIGSEDPSQDFQNYYAAQNKELIARMLMQQMQNSAQVPPQWDAMRLVPRRSALSNITTMLSGALAGRGLNQAQQAQTKYFQGLNNPQGQQSPQQPAPTGAPAFPADYQPGGGPSMPAPAAQPPNAPPQPAASAQQSGSAVNDYQQFLAQARRDSPALNMAANFNTPEWQKFSADAALKFGIPTGGERPGMPLMKGGRIIGYAPDPSKNVSYTMGPNGEPIAHAISGQAGIEAGTAGEVEEAKKRAGANYEMVEIPQGVGPPLKGTMADYLARTGPFAKLRYFPGDAASAQAQQPPAGAQSGPPAKKYGEQGYDPTDPRGMDYLRPAPSSAIQTNDVGAAEKFKQYLTKAENERAASATAATGAGRKDYYLDKALEALPKAPEGKGAEGLQDILGTLQTGGMLPQGLQDKLVAGQVVDKDLYQAASGGFQSLFGTNRVAQQEVMLAFKNMAPNLSQAKAATMQLVYENKVLNGYAKTEEAARQKAEDAGKDTSNFSAQFEQHYTRQDYEKDNRQAILDSMDARLKVGGGRMPGATGSGGGLVSMQSGGKTYQVHPSRVSEFKKAHPDAQQVKANAAGT